MFKDKEKQKAYQREYYLKKHQTLTVKPEPVSNPQSQDVVKPCPPVKPIFKPVDLSPVEPYNEAARIEQALGLLQTTGRARCEIKETAGRPLEVWRAA